MRTHRSNRPRPRPVGRCRTGFHFGAAFPAIVEVSYDAGTTWRLLTGGATPFTRRCGLFIEELDLHAGALVDPETGESFAERFIRGQVRVRITGTIEGDVAASVGRLSTTASRSNRVRGQFVRRGEDVLIAVREDRTAFTGGNSRFRESELPATERYSLADTWRYVAALERADRVRHSGNVQIPGILCARTLPGGTIEGFRPGDVVEGIYAQAGAREHDIDLSARGQGEEDYAIIAALLWRYDPGAEGKGATATTTLTLEDFAAISRVRGDL